MLLQIPAALMCILLGLAGADETVVISAAVEDDAKFLVHDVKSSYQTSTTSIRVLLPENVAADKSYPVVYVLPVEAGRETKYGDGLLEIEKKNLHNRFGAVFVAPTFSHLPWYADHATNLEIRQESYFVDVVVPFIDKTYPTPGNSGKRYLLGFSKSGWGAWTLLLRHADLFQKAAAWDAPLMMDQPGQYGSGEVFGTAANFESYQVTKLLERRAESLRNEKRLLLLGYGNFRAQHESAHALLDKLQIAHECRDGPARIHNWHSGWVTEAVELLLGEPDAVIIPSQTCVIPPGPNVQFDLQSRLILSSPGDVIQLEAGRYEFRGELNLVCRHVTLRGRGADKTILSFRDQEVGSDGLAVTGDGFDIEDLAVENTAGNAIKVLGARGVTFRRVRTEWTDGPKSTNGAYGIYPVQCSDVLIEDCVAIAAADAGIYVGQCERVIVRRCRAERNVAGIEIENTLHADVYENVAADNTGGILVFDLPGLPVANGGFTRVYRNRIEGNNHVNFAPKGNLVADVPAGTGLMIQAANNVEAFDNDIVDHDTANVLIISFLVANRPLRDPRYDPYSEGIAIHDNRIARGGKRPGGKLGESVAPLVGGRFADIVTDGAENRAKFENGKLPEALGIRLADNGDVTFLNFNLAKLTPANVVAGRYRFERDLGMWAGRLPGLSQVALETPARATGVNQAISIYREAPPILSAWGLFEGQPKKQQPAQGVLAYELSTPLFSDYTSKYRFIRLPQGQRLGYRSEGVLEFPVGTVIAKTFSMPHETSQPENAERLLETRIQVRKNSGWYGFSYVWDDQQREATLALGGGLCDVAWTHADGLPRTNRYEIPNANQCLSCHSRDGVFTPLGPTAANLNRKVAAKSAAGNVGPVNQLAHWQSLGVLEGMPVLDEVPQMPQFDDPQTGSVSKRARAWLDVNCAHCHQPAGSARTSGLDLRVSQSDPARYGVLKSPVAAGRGSGGRKYDIVPGQPDESILLFRLESTRPGIRMPNLSRNLVPVEGVELVREWIKSLPTSATE